MKKILFPLFTLFSLSLCAQIVVVPDAAFKSLLLSGTATGDIDGNTLALDTNNDGEIQLAEAQTIYGIYLWPNAQYQVSDLTGIEAFSNLKNLYIQEHLVTTLDMSANAHLFVLVSIDNPVTSIDLTNNLELDRLECPNNLLTGIDISNNINLHSLDIPNNQISNLDVTSNLNLERLIADDNQLSDLDVTNNLHLGTLSFYNNTLSAIDLTQNTELGVLYCQHNQLSTVDVSNSPSLDFFDCSYNPLTSFNIKNGSLLDIFGFASTPNLQYICADDFETDEVQAKITEYGYTTILVNTACNDLRLENLASNEASLFPNPATTEVTLTNIPVGSIILISDLTGKTVYTTITPSEQSVVNTSHFPGGIYLVNISYKEQNVTKRLIVK